MRAATTVISTTKVMGITIQSTRGVTSVTMVPPCRCSTGSREFPRWKVEVVSEFRPLVLGRLLRKPKFAMTPTELREILTHLYQDQESAMRFVAFELNISANTIKRWLEGRASIPGPAATAIRLLRDFSVPLKAPLTSEELDEAIDTLYDDPLLSQRRYRLAVDLGVSLTTVISWRAGRRPLRGPANTAIQLMLKKKNQEQGR